MMGDKKLLPASRPGLISIATKPESKHETGIVTFCPHYLCCPFPSVFSVPLTGRMRQSPKDVFIYTFQWSFTLDFQNTFCRVPNDLNINNGSGFGLSVS